MCTQHQNKVSYPIFFYLKIITIFTPMKDKVIVKEIDWDNITTIEQVKELLKGIELKFVFDKNNPATKSKIEVLKFKGIIK